MNPETKHTHAANGMGSNPSGDAGDIYLDLTPESAASLADWGWANEQLNAGAWDEYQGEYVAVAGKQLRGHGPSLRRLREDAARIHGLDPSRIVIVYVEPGIEG